MVIWPQEKCNQGTPKGKYGSEQESDETRILGGFLEDDEFGAESGHSLSF